MKFAEVADIWRTLPKRTNFAFRRITLRWKGSGEIGEGELTLVGPISVVVGENGVGKSVLLRTLFAALCGSASGIDRIAVARDFAGLVEQVELIAFSGEAAQGGAPTSWSGMSAVHAALNDESGRSRVALFDTAAVVPWMYLIIRADANFHDLLEGVSPRKFDAEELRAASYVVGRDYDWIEVMEITDYRDLDVVPFFRACRKGATFTSVEMGSGELAALFVLWRLHRATPHSILLFEEPETFLAPRSQSAIMNVIAKRVGELGALAIVTSHSPGVVERVPLSNVVLASRMGNAVSFVAPAPESVLVDRIGIRTGARVVLLVEDEVSHALTAALLAIAGIRELAEPNILNCKGVGNIREIVARFPRVAGMSVRIVAVLDGDQRDQKALAGSWPTAFLPTSMSPEEMLRHFLLSKTAEGLAHVFAIARPQIEAAFGSNEGQENHEWLRATAQALHLSVSEFVAKAARTWAVDNPTEFQAFCTSLS